MCPICCVPCPWPWTWLHCRSRAGRRAGPQIVGPQLMWSRKQSAGCMIQRFTLTMLHTIQTNELRSCGSKLVEKTSSECPEHCPKLSAPLPRNILFRPGVAESAFTKPPLFQRNRLACSGNPSFESCVEGKAQQREIEVYSRSSFQRPQH